MQVDPNAAAIVYVRTPHGGELTLDPGREVVARVVSVGNGGAARISLGGQELDVNTDAMLRAGDHVRLSVTRADADGVRLAIIPPDGGAASNAAHGRGTSTIVSELARAGVPVTPQLAHAVANLAEQLGGGATSTRAAAQLAGRDLLPNLAAAGRVAAALELAGSLGPALTSLASRSADVAAALPVGTPGTAAMRSLLAPNLAASELAVARIVQAAQASAPGGPVTLPTPPSSSASVIRNYVASQVAITARLDDLAARNSVLGGAQSSATRAPHPVTPNSSLANLAMQAAVRGQEAGAETGPRLVPAPAVAPAATAQAASAASARTNATASAATGAASATATPTNARAAQAITDLANLAIRFAPAVAPGAGAMGTATSSAARGMSATDIAQQAGRAGAARTASATVAGASAAGDPAPLVTALQRFLASPAADDDAARLMRVISGATPAALAAAIRTLPESQAMQLAGHLLDLMPAGSQLSGPALLELRHGIHAALDQLGRSLLPPGSDEHAALRRALEHVAANDPRPSVANDAARMLAAVDGQQILSRTAHGADPGYVYFQVPMPDGRGAEVMVRREPGRRQVTFDEFNIAFLLDTERLGTLMIQLDAHPAGIRADVRTDVPELEPWLRARAEALVEPLGRESRRPVTVTTGVFEQEPPTSLLDPILHEAEAGSLEFYA